MLSVEGMARGLPGCWVYWETFDPSRYRCRAADAGVRFEPIGTSTGTQVSAKIGLCVRVLHAEWPAVPNVVIQMDLRGEESILARALIDPLPMAQPIPQRVTDYEIRAIVFSPDEPHPSCSASGLCVAPSTATCERRPQ